jgi:hypothetical protein
MKWLQTLCVLGFIAVVLPALMLPGCATASRTGRAPGSPDQVLTDFHDAAAKSDEARYFGHFARSGSVFIGTDATERWNLEQFRAFAHPYFAQGKGWTYTLVPGTRSISFIRGTSVAYFDELLQNAKLGTCRGSGVLVIEDEVWKVAQYNLSIPVPNDKAGPVVELIQGKR